MEKTYWDGYLEGMTESDKEYANERAIKKANRQEIQKSSGFGNSIKNFCINHKSKVMVAILSGTVVAIILTKGDEIVAKMNNFAKSVVEHENEQFRKETESKLAKVEKLTGKTIDEIVNGPENYDALAAEYKEGYNYGVREGSKWRDIDMEKGIYDSNVVLSTNHDEYVGAPASEEYKAGFEVGFKDGYKYGANNIEGYESEDLIAPKK